MPTTSSRIEERYASICQRIEVAAQQTGRKASDITLLAVSKRQPEDRIRALLELGHRDFGENLIQEWKRKHEVFQDVPDLRWHLIGPVQSNKAKFIARSLPALLHSVDREALVESLDKRIAPGAKLRVLIQVNIDREPQKAGIDPEGIRSLAERITSSDHLELGGLMCIPAANTDARPAFARMRTLGERIEDLCIGRPALSMGMSQDFESAVLEGATIVRVGSALFGPRDT